VNLLTSTELFIGCPSGLGMAGLRGIRPPLAE